MTTFRDTSHQARPKDAKKYRELVLSILDKKPVETADGIAEDLNLSPLSIRPRLTELQYMGLVEDSSLRARNISGKKAIMWRRTNRNRSDALSREPEQSDKIKTLKREIIRLEWELKRLQNV